MGKSRPWTPSSHSQGHDRILLSKVEEIIAEFPHYKPEQIADQLTVYPQFKKATRIVLLREVKKAIEYLSSNPAIDDSAEGDSELDLTMDVKKDVIAEQGNIFAKKLLQRTKKQVEAHVARTPTAEFDSAETPLKTPKSSSKKDDQTPRHRDKRLKSERGLPPITGPAGSGGMGERFTAQTERPKYRLRDLGGIQHIIEEVQKQIALPLKHDYVFSTLGVEPPRGVLLHGPPGCGKTLLANAIAGEYDVPFFKISAPEIVSGMSGESEAKIRSLFADAQAAAPCIIFIDEVDAITPKRETAAREMERRIVSQLLTCMDELSTCHKPVMIIGATNRPDALDPALRRAGRFDRELCLGIPDIETRVRILEVLAAKLKLSGDFDFHEISRLTAGFVGADLGALTKEAALLAVNRIFHEHLSTAAVSQRRANTATAPNGGNNGTDDGTVLKPKALHLGMDGSATAEVGSVDHMDVEQPSTAAAVSERPSTSNGTIVPVAEPYMREEELTEEELASLSITMDDFRDAVKHVQPSLKREGFTTVPGVTWSDIGALEKVRNELQSSIVQPIKDPESYKRFGLTAPAGVLLWGPPGCGKTLLAKAVANESGANFISIKGPELLNKYVGESERAVRQVFQRARASAPCVLFFDEMDALAPNRTGGDSASSERVVNQLLSEMDGIDGRAGVYIIAATNRPDCIDRAILRPGRLDKLILVPLPDEKERLAILTTHVRGKPLSPEGIDLTQAAARAEWFSGADCSALVREAALNAMSSGAQFISTCDFMAAFSKVKPSVSQKDVEKYRELDMSMNNRRE